MKTQTITDKKTYRAYMIELVVVALVGQATCERSIEDLMLEKANEFGRTAEDAKLDVKCALNMCSAISLVLEKSATDKFN